MEWISVKDSLPDYNERVLLVGKHNIIYIGWREHSNWKGKEHFSIGRGCGLSSVTHWMPLPEYPSL